MKIKNVYMISLIIIIITVILMGINLFISPSPFSDIAIRVIGVIMLIDIFVLSYSTVKLKKKQ